MVPATGDTTMNRGHRTHKTPAGTIVIRPNTCTIGDRICLSPRTPPPASPPPTPYKWTMYFGDGDEVSAVFRDGFVRGRLHRNPDGGWAASIDWLHLYPRSERSKQDLLLSDAPIHMGLGDTRREAVESAVEVLEDWLGCRVEN
jgi:hypothetical protein